MLHKMRTDTAAIAFKARTGMPRDYRETVEQDLQTLFLLYNSCFIRGKRNDFFEMLGAFCKEQMFEILAADGSIDVSKLTGPASQANPQSGKCAACGGVGGKHDVSKH